MTDRGPRAERMLHEFARRDEQIAEFRLTRFHQRQQHRLLPRGRAARSATPRGQRRRRGWRRRGRRANRCWRSTQRPHPRTAAPRPRAPRATVADLNAAAHVRQERIQRHHIGARRRHQRPRQWAPVTFATFAAFATRGSGRMLIRLPIRLRHRRDARDAEQPAPQRSARARRPTAIGDRCRRHHATRSRAARTAGRCHCASVASGIAITSASPNASAPASARSVAQINRAVASSAAAIRDHTSIRVVPIAPSAAARIAGAPSASRISTIHGLGTSLDALDALRDFAVASDDGGADAVGDVVAVWAAGQAFPATPARTRPSHARRRGRVRCRLRLRGRYRPASS